MTIVDNDGCEQTAVYQLLEPPVGNNMADKTPGASWSTQNGVVNYQGFGNQHGFTYQAEAVHCCIAAGLKGCPQFTKEESLHVMKILDSVHEQTGMH